MLANNKLLYSHKVYDMLDTADGSALSQGCVHQYAVEWRRQVGAMTAAINKAVAEDGLCEQLATTVTNYVESFASLGNQVGSGQCIIRVKNINGLGVIRFGKWYTMQDYVYYP